LVFLILFSGSIPARDILVLPVQYCPPPLGIPSQLLDNGKLFQSFFFYWGYVCFLKFTFRKIIFQIFLCLFTIRKIGKWKTLFSQRKIWLDFQESVFLENLGELKHFPEVVKNLKVSYYLLIISNLVLKLLITIYILFWIFIF
jgi:hypothetical protein